MIDIGLQHGLIAIMLGLSRLREMFSQEPSVIQSMAKALLTLSDVLKDKTKAGGVSPHPPFHNH